MSDPAHESHAETQQWIGKQFDLKDADLKRLSEAVDALAAKWGRTASNRKIRSRI